MICKEIKKCLDNGIIPYINKPKLSSRQGIDSEFYPDKFKYDKNTDCYTCPNNQILNFKGTKKSERGYIVRLYKTPACQNCNLKSKCASSEKGRTIHCSEYAEYMEEMIIRLKINKEKVKKRKSIVEHPFGTIKESFGYRKFLMKGLANVKTEIGLAILAYNMKRAINELGIKKLIKAMA